jgi:subtilisin-like proprotein convertase family protein
MRFYLLLLLLTATQSMLFAQVFQASVLQNLSEGTANTFNLNVAGLPTVQDASFGLFEVDIKLLHPNTGEMELRLQSPDGTNYLLAYQNGTQANFNHAKFRVYASKSINITNSPYNGQLMGYESINNFQNGSNPNGTWSLIYNDIITNGSVALLESWHLSFTNNPTKKSLDSMQTLLPIIDITTTSNIPQNPKTAGMIKVFNNINNSLIDLPSNVYDIGIEVQGYTSSGGGKPNYDFEIRNATGQSLDVPLLGLPPESDWIIKSGYTDNFLMKDPLTFEFSRRMGYYAPRTKHVEVFINGDYVGIYILTEKVKRNLNRVDISKLKPTDLNGANITGGYIFEINPNGSAAAWNSLFLGYNGSSQTNGYEFKIVYPKADSLQMAQKDYLHDFVDSFEIVMNSSNFQDTINGWRKYVKEKTFIDFMIVSEYSLNYDTYGRSMYFSKSKLNKGNKIQVGPPWDADRGYDFSALNAGWVHITTHGYWTFPFWWVKLRQDSLFEKRLACRFKTVRNYIITDTAIDNYINTMDALLQQARPREILRWSKYFEDPADLKYVIKTRLNWMYNEVENVGFPPNPVVSNLIQVGDAVDIFQGNEYKYNFKPGPDTSFFILNNVGIYTAIIANQYGCETQKKFEVLVNTPLDAVVDLKGVLNNSTSVLSWEIPSSVSITYFDIEHSFDAKNFKSIGVLKRGTNDKYSFEHKTINTENFLATWLC